MGCHFLLQDLSNLGIQFASPTWAGGFSTAKPPGKPIYIIQQFTYAHTYTYTRLYVCVCVLYVRCMSVIGVCICMLCVCYRLCVYKYVTCAYIKCIKIYHLTFFLYLAVEQACLSMSVIQSRCTLFPPLSCLISLCSSLASIA